MSLNVNIGNSFNFFSTKETPKTYLHTPTSHTPHSGNSPNSTPLSSAQPSPKHLPPSLQLNFITADDNKAEPNEFLQDFVRVPNPHVTKEIVDKVGLTWGLIKSSDPKGFKFFKEHKKNKQIAAVEAIRIKKLKEDQSKKDKSVSKDKTIKKGLSIEKIDTLSKKAKITTVQIIPKSKVPEYLKLNFNSDSLNINLDEDHDLRDPIWDQIDSSMCLTFFHNYFFKTLEQLYPGKFEVLLTGEGKLGRQIKIMLDALIFVVRDSGKIRDRDKHDPEKKKNEEDFKNALSGVIKYYYKIGINTSDHFDNLARVYMRTLKATLDTDLTDEYHLAWRTIISKILFYIDGYIAERVEEEKKEKERFFGKPLNIITSNFPHASEKYQVSNSLEPKKCWSFCVKV